MREEKNDSEDFFYDVVCPWEKSQLLIHCPIMPPPAQQCHAIAGLDTAVYSCRFSPRPQRNPYKVDS